MGAVAHSNTAPGIMAAIVALQLPSVVLNSQVKQNAVKRFNGLIILKAKALHGFTVGNILGAAPLSQALYTLRFSPLMN